MNADKVVLAYSGGLDTSVILRWLKEQYGCEVVAFCADLGQGEDLQAVKRKALRTGASKAVVGDLREEFVKDYVFPMLRANAVYEGSYLFGTSIARPLIAKAQIDVAAQEHADAVSHGATGKGNDQVRFELTYYALKPGIKVIAPWRIWDLNSRSSLMAYASKHGIPVPVTKAKPYSTDRNLFHISYEGGILEDPWKEPPADMFVWCRPLEKTPNRAEYVEIDYRRGDPVAMNGRKLSPAKLLAALNGLGAKHGIGRVDVVENRYVGMKSRGVYETPGGTILHAAHRALESITMDREVLRLRDSLIPRYAEMIYYGYWFAPEREVLQKTIDAAQANVSGRARLKLYKGNVMVAGRKSDTSLYDPKIATFEEDDVYHQGDADGFIRLNALRLRLQRPRQEQELKGLRAAIENSKGRHRPKLKIGRGAKVARAGKLWGGRFAKATAESVEAFTASIDVDRRLYRHDIAGSIAHAKMLSRQRIIPARDAQKIVRGLKAIRERNRTRRVYLLSRRRRYPHEHRTAPDRKDRRRRRQAAHGAQPQRPGGAGHAAVSPGRGCSLIIGGFGALERELARSAKRHIDVIMPGYTHLQRAQPVLFSHHLLAYYDMFERDRERFAGALERINVLPLGSGALGGNDVPHRQNLCRQVARFPAGVDEQPRRGSGP